MKHLLYASQTHRKALKHAREISTGSLSQQISQQDLFQPWATWQGIASTVQKNRLTRSNNSMENTHKMHPCFRTAVAMSTNWIETAEICSCVDLREGSQKPASLSLWTSQSRVLASSSWAGSTSFHWPAVAPLQFPLYTWSLSCVPVHPRVKISPI